MFEIRDLKSSDIFGMCRIIGKIGVKEFKAVFSSDEIRDAIAGATKADGKVDLNRVGFSVVTEIAAIVIANLPAAESEIYTFLAGLTGKTRRDLENMPAVEFAELVVAVVKHPGFSDFFRVASSLLV